MPEKLGNFYTGGFYLCVSCAMLHVSTLASPKLASSVGLCFPVLADVESSFKGMVEDSVDNDFVGREIAACFLDAPTHRRKED